jgi:lipoate-protein ligase A
MGTKEDTRPLPLGMPRPTLHVLPYAVADGPHNMAADEVMLEAALGGHLALRLYGWRPTTISLGYFQKAKDRLQVPGGDSFPWVRRCTGGGAIVHHRDLTYALALPPDVAKRQPPAQWHDELHRLMADLLRQNMLPAVLVEGERLRPDKLDYLCFAVPQPGDVVMGGTKIIGGAQRTRKGALLQHGSIVQQVANFLVSKLAPTLADRMGWTHVDGAWSPEESTRIEDLAAEKYGTAGWNEKR